MRQIFLSYAAEDKVDAGRIKDELEQHSVIVWRDQENIQAGDPWRQEIETGIAASDAIIILLTPHSCASPYVTFEWAYGLGLGKRLIPLLWQDCQVHPRLEALQYIDFRDQPRNLTLMTPEALERKDLSVFEGEIEGVWGDTFKVEGQQRVALINIRKADGTYWVKGYEFDANLNVIQFWESDFSRFDQKRRNFEYFYHTTQIDAAGIIKLPGFTEISFSGTSGGHPNSYKGVFKDFSSLRTGFISGHRVADSLLFNDEKGQKELARKLLQTL